MWKASTGETGTDCSDKHCSEAGNVGKARTAETNCTHESLAFSAEIVRNIKLVWNGVLYIPTTGTFAY